MFRKRILATLGILVLSLPLYSGCAADSQQNPTDPAPSDGEDLSLEPSGDPGTDVAPPAEPDELTTDDDALDEPVMKGEKLAASAEVNLHGGPSATGAVVGSVPEGGELTVVSPAPSHGFYEVTDGAHTGWVSGMFLVKPSSSEGSISSDEEMSSDATKTNTAVSRALEWVKVKMPYCGGPNGGHDAICRGTCRRHGAADNPKWNRYRSDCSGLVSFAWGLPPPGRIGGGFGGVSHVVSPGSIKPGDALDSVPAAHMMLFVGWVNKAKGEAKVIQEFRCHHVAREMVLRFDIGSRYLHSLDFDGRYFQAIRKR